MLGKQPVVDRRIDLLKEYSKRIEAATSFEELHQLSAAQAQIHAEIQQSVNAVNALVRGWSHSPEEWALN